MSDLTPQYGQSEDVLYPCWVLMEDGSWRRGEVLETRDTVRGIGALVRCAGITAWLFRAQGRGRPDEWKLDRPSDRGGSGR